MKCVVRYDRVAGSQAGPLALYARRLWPYYSYIETQPTLRDDP
jgi:hypothetical protein